MSKIVVIVIDAGHGGTDRANRGPTGYIEADGNLLKALALRDNLLSNYSNVKVILTRETDKTVSRTARGKMAAGADLFISIHSNGHGDVRVRGSEVFYSVKHPRDKAFAADLSLAYAKELVTNDRGAKVMTLEKDKTTDYLTVIKVAEEVKCKHILLTEELFHSNAFEEGLLKQRNFPKVFAEITVSVLAKYLPLVRKDIDVNLTGVPKMYQEAWIKAVKAGVEDGVGPDEVVTSAKLMAYFDKMGLLEKGGK